MGTKLRNANLKRLTDHFEDILDLTIFVTGVGLVLVLVLFLYGKITEKTWAEMTTLLYDGGLLRMWALLVGAVAVKWGKAWADRGQKHDPDQE